MARFLVASCELQRSLLKRCCGVWVGSASVFHMKQFGNISMETVLHILNLLETFSCMSK